MNTIWVLVANRAEAQIYSAKRLPGKLILVDSLVDAEGAVRAGELTSDAPGRVHDRIGAARHAMEPDTGVKDEGRRRFVKKMVGRLKAAHFKGDFDQLVLLAAPAVLGVIRKTLTKELAGIVVKVISKDVIGQGMDKIQLQVDRSFQLK